MARFEIIVRRPTPEGTAGERHVVLGRLGSAVAAALTGLLAVGIVIVALVLGYLIAGLIVAAFLVVVLAALLRGAFRSLRI